MTKVIVCRWIPRGFCVNLFGTVWTRDDRWIDDVVINHERIHTAQQRELLFVMFYVIYGLEWLLRLVQCRHWYRAYRAISFEREAYREAGDLSYLARRPRFAQWRGHTDGSQ
ncbi:MAG: hypothetical protein NC117_02365 [Pseudoflavonifractor sp.]|nr:hypothetical protein [Pseudoflavonifractor sp.]